MYMHGWQQDSGYDQKSIAHELSVSTGEEHQL